MTTTHPDPRLLLELQVLEATFGRCHAFRRDGAVSLEVGLTTNSKHRYATRLVLPNDYPNSMPTALITYPQRLLDRHGRDLALLTPSHAMHTLGSHDGLVSICHYHPSRWTPANTLYKVVIKVRCWLEAYELHRATGHVIDHYLRTMGESA